MKIQTLVMSSYTHTNLNKNFQTLNNIFIGEVFLINRYSNRYIFLCIMTKVNQRSYHSDFFDLYLKHFL